MSRVVNKFEGRETRRSDNPLFKPLVALALVLIGVFAFSALVTLSGYSDDLRQKETGQATPLSRSAVGYAGLVQLLEDIEFDVKTDPKPYKSAWQTRNRLRIYTPATIFKTKDLEAISKSEPALIVLPKWLVAEMRDKPGWVQKSRFNNLRFVNELSQIIGKSGNNIYLDQLRGDEINAELRYEIGEVTARTEVESLQFFTRTRPLPTNIKTTEDDASETDETDTDETSLAEKALDTLENIAQDAANVVRPPLDSLMRAEGDRAILIKLPDTKTYVLSDPDFFNTQGIASQSRARLAVDILETVIAEEKLYNRAVTFDLSLHGIGGKPNLIKLMTQPPFLAATLCLIAAGMLIGWQGFTRFGDPRRETPDYSLGPASLAKTSAVFFAANNRLGSMGRAYAALTRRQVIRRLGLTGQDSRAIDKRLAARENLRNIQPKFSSLNQNPQSDDAAGFTTQAKALAKWKEEMLREP